MAITTERLRKLLSYDPETGEFTWRVGIGRKIKAGDRAGSLNNKGYIRIRVDRKQYLAHRLDWLYMTGKWPADQVDHKDTNPANNRWANLRQADSTLNNENRRKARMDNYSGFQGVTPFRGCRLKKPWRSRIKVAGKSKTLGYFPTPQDAHKAYLRAKRRIAPGMHNLKGKDMTKKISLTHIEIEQTINAYLSALAKSEGQRVADETEVRYRKGHFYIHPPKCSLDFVAIPLRVDEMVVRTARLGGQG